MNAKNVFVKIIKWIFYVFEAAVVLILGVGAVLLSNSIRSEERRVGKECG